MSEEINWLEIKSNTLTHILKRFSNNFTCQQFSGKYVFNSIGEIKLKKSLWGRTDVEVQVVVGTTAPRKNGIELRIEYLLFSSMYESVFEGWIESVEDFRIVSKCVGL